MKENHVRAKSSSQWPRLCCHQAFSEQTNFNVFPFRTSSKRTLHCRSRVLRTGLLVAKHSCDETLVFLGADESHVGSCYYHQDLHKTPLHTHSHVCFDAMSSPRYSLVHKTHTNGRTSANCLNAIHFRYSTLRLVSCYTLLRWYRLPWSRSRCLKCRTSFMVIFLSCLAPYCGVRFIPHRSKTLHLTSQTSAVAKFPTQLRRREINPI